MSKDTTYEYSKYILWGLAEVATSELVFCSPAFPVIFRHPSILRKAYDLLRSKITFIAPLKSKPAIQERPNPRYTIFDIGSEAAFTRLEPIKIQAELSLDQPRTGFSVDATGILVTTVIDTRSHEDLSTVFERVRIESR